MKIKTKVYLFLLFMLGLTGCAATSQPSMTSAPPLNVQDGVEVTSNLIDSETTQSAIKINNSHIYYSQIDGANAAVGLLGGALGSLVNSAIIENKTTNEADSLGFKSRELDLTEKVRKSFDESSDTNHSKAYKLEPFILLQSRDDRIYLSLVYYLKLNESYERSWSERYFYHFKEEITPEDNVTQTVNKILSRSIEEAISKLSALVSKDIKVGFNDASLVNFQTPLLGPLPGPYVGKILLKNNSEVTIRSRGNKTKFRGVYIRGTHIIPLTHVTLTSYNE